MKIYLAKEDEEDISNYPAIKWGHQHEKDGADRYNETYQAQYTYIRTVRPYPGTFDSFITGLGRN